MNITKPLFYHQMFFMILCCTSTNIFSMKKNSFRNASLLDEANLRNAAANNNIAQLRRLITQGVDVDAKNPISGDTALHLAIRKEDLRAVRLLIRGGASMDIENNEKHTPFNMVMATTANNKQLTANQAALNFTMIQHTELIGGSPSQQKISATKDALLQAHAMALRIRLKELAKTI